MDFAERIKRNAGRLRRMRPERIAPAATVRKDFAAGAWSADEPLARLARICRAAAGALREQPLLAARYDGAKRLRPPDAPRLRVGPEGGRRWLLLQDAEELAAADLQRRLADDGGAEDSVEGLELLDLSTLGVADWRGSLVAPQVGRLVLLAPGWRPARDGSGPQAVLPLALDFDQRLLAAAQAAAFVDAVAAALGRDAA